MFDRACSLLRNPPPLKRTARYMSSKRPSFRKILLVSVKLFVRNSGAGNGCANFMGTWKKCVVSAGKTRVHKIPPFRGGGVLGRGGGECRFYFYGREDFSDSYHPDRNDFKILSAPKWLSIWHYVERAPHEIGWNDLPNPRQFSAVVPHLPVVNQFLGFWPS